jgi:hypothetical protein
MTSLIKSIISAARRMHLNEQQRDNPYTQRCECGNVAYTRNGKTYKLRAECGCIALAQMLSITAEPNETPQQTVDRALDYTPYGEWNK